MKKEFIKWKDEDYRDDRMMVMNIAPAKDAEGKECWESNHLQEHNSVANL